MLLAANVAIAADPPHIFYVVKYGDDSWFINEVAGAKAEADRLGVKFTSQNVKQDSNSPLPASTTPSRPEPRASSSSSPSRRSGPPS